MKKLSYKLFMLCTTAVISAGNVKAENCMPTDCAAMGFTQTKDDCSGYNSLLCPYDLSKYFCSSDVCDSMFQYACTGTGYDGGFGYACNGKYSRCSCSKGYEWSDTVCEKCDSSYNLVCHETGYKGVTPSCGGYYKSCTCDDGFCMDSNGKCTQDACKMDYTLQLNYSMPWGSCTNLSNWGGGATWMVTVRFYKPDGMTLVSSASLMLTSAELSVNGSGRRSASFDNKIAEGEYILRIENVFSNKSFCANGSTGIKSVIAGSNTVTLPITANGVTVGLYKRNQPNVTLSAEFGTR